MAAFTIESAAALNTLSWSASVPKTASKVKSWRRPEAVIDTELNGGKGGKEREVYVCVCV